MSRKADRDERPVSSRETGPDEPTGRPTEGGSTMLAWTWVIAGRYGDPADHGVPELPEWRVSRTDARLSFVAEAGSEPFISAENPV